LHHLEPEAFVQSDVVFGTGADQYRKISLFGILDRRVQQNPSISLTPVSWRHAEDEQIETPVRSKVVSAEGRWSSEDGR